MNKDLTDENRAILEGYAASWAEWLQEEGQSLAIARECLINAFDRMAEELDG